MTAANEDPRPWIVIKFGGTSVSTCVRWETIHSIARAHIAKGRRPLIVCSALSGVSNALEQVLDDAGNGPAQGTLQILREQHDSLAADLGLDGAALLGELFEELQALCFMAGANSIFTGDKLLTTPNPGEDHDKTLLDKMGMAPMELAARA